jgi:hypothetical protein
LTKRLALLLTHHFKIVLGSGVLVRGHEVGNKLMT